MLTETQTQQLMSANRVYKRDEIDPASRLESLLDLWEPRVARAFLRSVNKYRNEVAVDEIIELINQGRLDEVITQFEAIANRVATTSGAAYAAAATSTAAFLSEGLDIIIDFDSTNEAAVQELRANRLRLVQGFTQEQIQVTRNALVEGTTRGLNPVEQARNFRDNIGLTVNQQAAVLRYRRNLETLSSDALNRELRDRRFDRTVARAIRNDQPLTRTQINRMVSRYQDRFRQYRSKVIGRTEALRSVHAGNVNMYRQAIERGAIQDDQIIREWRTASDSRVRDSHSAMNGEKVTGIDSVFNSGNGNQLRYPGDINAPASETVQCRCVVTTRISLPD